MCGLCSQAAGTGGEGAGSTSTRGGLDWVLVKIHSLKGFSDTGTGCPGQSPSLKVFKELVDVAPGDGVQW